MSKNCVTHHFACDCREQKFAELERENAALKQALDAQMQYQRELRADRDRLDWLLTYEGRTWFCQKLDSGEWIKSVGSVRSFIDAAMGVKP